jgi:phosphatidylglycerophosphatase A
MNLPSDADRDDARGRVPWRDPALLVATCGGIGRVPTAPGTAGAALGVPLAVATGAVAAWVSRGAASSVAGTAAEAAVLAGLCLVGVPICGRAAALLGRGKDPGAVVYDEMAALPLVLLPVPPAARSVVCLAAAFVLFRIFDIAKPWPCRRLERLHDGWGIMADDWAAAAWAAACLAVARSLGVV